MDITITIPDSKKDLIIDSFCSLYKYRDEINQYDEVTGETTVIPNPETKGQFTKRQFIDLIKNTVKRYHHQTDETTFNTALQQKKEAVDSIDIT